MNYFIPCAETEHCFFQECKGKDKVVKYCRILNSKDGSAPYRPGKCAYFKRTENGISGDYGKDKKGAV